MSIRPIPIRDNKNVRDQVSPKNGNCAANLPPRIGVYDAKSRDWTAGMALADKLFPEYKN